MAESNRKALRTLPERINKLQPDRTVQLRGFDSFAAAASIHSASPTGFTVSGTFRDPADFAVAVLYDADSYFEHPSIKYLPDFNFSGLTLNFNLEYSDSLQPIDSPKFNWIDWATLDCIRADGTNAQVRLWDNAMLVGTSFPAATATCQVLAGANGIQGFDRLTLWFQNLAFDYIAPDGKSSLEFDFFAAGNGAVHSITINGTTYSHTESNPLGETSSDQATALIEAITAADDPYVIASPGSVSNAVLLTVRPDKAGIAIAVSATDGNAAATMLYTTPQLVATALVNEINSTNWSAANTTHALLAAANGTQITLTAARYGNVNVDQTSVTWVSGAVFAGLTPGSTILIGGGTYAVASVQSPTQLTLAAQAPAASNVSYTAPRGGRDGNLIEMYTISKNSNLSFDQSQIQFAGGSSSVTWNCTIDFTAQGIDQIRQCWLTFAPSLELGSYPGNEWEAVFSNWQLTGPESTMALSVAGPGSVRIEETDSACGYKGVWTVESGFYSKYFANSTSDPTASVTVTYTCLFTHDLYIGTSLYPDRAVVGIQLDGDTETSLDCRLDTETEVVARRSVRTSVAAGRHAVTISIQQAGVFYFDFLEAAVLSDVPDALTPRPNISPALDFDTDHSYKLSPSRLMWIMDKLGYAGPMNEYLGVFWWNERVLSGGSVSNATIGFTGTFVDGDSITLTLSGTALIKTVFPADTLSTIAYHFAAYINSTFVGAWASASGSNLMVTSRSPAPAYAITLSLAVTSAAGQAAVTEQPVAGQYGTWVVNDATSTPINRATRDWHADFYSQCASRSREVVTSCSMELVNPPAGYGALFPDAARTPVSTATGFGSLVSNHCAAGSSKLLAYQKSVYRTIAQMQSAAGLTPTVQYGEFLWWYFARIESLTVGYASYTSPISIGTTTPHGLTSGMQVVIYGVGGNTAANGTWLVAVTDSTHFTLNGSSGNGTYTSGGTVSVDGGGMAFYDDETMAAAETALGRPLYVFNSRQDDPSVNGGADAVFLRNRLRDHVGALVADIRSAFPSVKCEVLWPYDVNHPTPVPAVNPTLGGPLLRFVNLPVEWQTQPASGLDRMKVEALSFGSGMRNLDLVNEAIGLFPAFGWPLNSLRYLVPVFGSATPWNRELALALGAGITTNNLWAFDHVCLFNLDVPEKPLERRSLIKAA